MAISVAAALTVSVGFGGASPVQAFDELSKAQELIYAERHLKDTTAGQALVYQYLSVSPEEDSIEDTVTLNVTKALDDDRRDITLEFLTDTRKMILPDFQGYRGNPVVIAMLEHISQTAGRQTGGGALYFRNRIRDALAVQDLPVTSANKEFEGKQIPVKEIVLRPFVGDKFLKGNELYENMQYRLVFSSVVPAGVLEVSVESADSSGKTIASQSIKLLPTKG